MSYQEPPPNPILVLLGAAAFACAICLAGIALYEAGVYAGQGDAARVCRVGEI